MQTKLNKKIIDNKNFQNYESLKGLIFYVKDYQRSYKWEKEQVITLLNDIEEFVINTPLANTTLQKYCLQPLVVKEQGGKFTYSHKLGEDALSQKKQFSNNTTAWEVIDGQQRLTTLWLILNACQKKLNQPQNVPFEIYYEQFRAMDDYYIANANTSIENWLQSRDYDDVADIRKCIMQFVMLIWYEVDKNTNSVDIFTRLNIGKIPLTDAELFKAMLLKPSTVYNDRLDVIAYEWDSIEHQLRNEDFWYFISNTDMVGETRIDFLLRLYAVNLCATKLVNEPLDENGELFSFLAINKYLEIDSKATPINVWEDIVQIFETLKWWYNDHELYHNTGFLIKEAKEKNKYKLIKDLYNYANEHTKSQFHVHVHSAIKLIFSKILKKGKQLSELEYGSDSDNIEKVLLYFNLLTMINSLSGQRFSFRNFKTGGTAINDEGETVKTKWQLEHIHAQATDEQIRAMEKPKRKEFLEGLKKELDAIHDQSSKKLIDDKLANDYYAQMSGDDFYKFYKDIVTTYGEVEMHSIGNLTLLDSATNESYHNDLFPNKRRVILDRDRKGIFIPICTHNVFLKAYSNSMGNMMKWTKDDAEAYTNTILRAFKENGIW